MNSELRLSLIGLESTCRRLLEQVEVMNAILREDPTEDIATGGRLIHDGHMLGFFAAKMLGLMAELHARQSVGPMPAERMAAPPPPQAVAAGRSALLPDIDL